MKFEVECKFAVPDVDQFITFAAKHDVVFGEPVRHVDQYLAHPSRDFSVTDEALRIRQVGQHAVVTYKGPRVDATTKTRRELEVSLAGGTTDDVLAIFIALGFKPVAEVCKRRRSARILLPSREIHVDLDEVEKVGTYVELECLADSDDVDGARQAVMDLADQWKLGTGERRSYLELLLLLP
ncbi:MAG: class IV adenylate cyclase [Pirellulaceae bacterium]|nr:class IV adenylate cyclase [Planctomycetales bacterium]